MSASKATRRKAALATAEPTGFLLVISGPAGVGKDTIWQTASRQLPTFAKALTCTTRPRRPGENEGVDYHFVSEEEFDRMIREDELLEKAYVHGFRYGVPVFSVIDRLNSGLDVVCVIDVQGAQSIRSLLPQSLLVFIKPPVGREADVLKERIEGRGSVGAEELQRRLETAAWELTHLPLYDYQIVNDDVDAAARELCEIVLREKARHQPQAQVKQS